MPRRLAQSATQAENNLPRDLETHTSSKPQVEFGPVELVSFHTHTMGPTGTVYLSYDESQLIGPQGYATFPEGAFSSYA